MVCLYKDTLFLIYCDPDFSGIVWIIRFIRWVNFDFYATGILIPITARKELTDDLPIRFNEGFRHLALERKYCVGELRKLNDLKSIIHWCSIILSTNSIREQISFRFE